MHGVGESEQCWYDTQLSSHSRLTRHCHGQPQYAQHSQEPGEALRRAINALHWVRRATFQTNGYTIAFRKLVSASPSIGFEAALLVMKNLGNLDSLRPSH